MIGVTEAFRRFARVLAGDGTREERDGEKS